MLACAVYLLMLFILLPVRHLRYFLPLALIVGWSISGYLAQFERPLVRAAALVALIAVTVLPSYFLVGGLSKVPPPVAALDWVKANRPAAILYSDQLRRHADFYWPGGDSKAEPKVRPAAAAAQKPRCRARCARTTPELCGMAE